MVFFAVQIRQFNVIRDDPSRPHFFEDEKLRRMEQHIQFLEKRINDTNEVIMFRTDEIEDKLETTQNRIQENTDDILKQQEYGENVHQKLSEMDQSIGSINDSISQNDGVSVTDEMENMLEYWRAKKQTNWVSEIHAKPQSVSYGFNDYSALITSDSDVPNESDGTSSGALGILGAIRRGGAMWLEEQRRGPINTENLKEELWRDTANRNLADDASPQTLEPHDCLQLSTETGDRWIELKLIERVIPSEFEYIHIAKEKIPEKDLSKKPKRFRLRGKVKGGNWTDIVVMEDKDMKLGDDKLVLEFAEEQKGIEYLRIEWDVHHDAESTRLYRFRVHGIPDVN